MFAQNFENAEKELHHKNHEISEKDTKISEYQKLIYRLKHEHEGINHNHEKGCEEIRCLKQQLKEALLLVDEHKEEKLHLSLLAEKVKE